jgi:hypothetical protein
VLDVDMVYAMAPGAAIRFFKTGIHWFGILDNCLAQMANYPGQLTVAWALGCSFLTSSGDDGCAAVISSNLRMTSNLRMNSQTIVGGTILFLRTASRGRTSGGVSDALLP